MWIKPNRSGNYHISTVFYKMLCICFLLPCYFTSYSQKFILEEFGSKQGIASAEIYTLFQDEGGYLWMGTRLGVSKFDGLRFTNYNGSNEKRFGKVFSITQDEDHCIWIGAENGLFFYFANEIKQIKFDKSFPDPWIYSVHCADGKSLWIGTASGPVFLDKTLVDKVKNGDVLKYKLFGNWQNFGDPGNQVLKITNNNSDIYFGTRGSLIKYDGTQYSLLWQSREARLEDVSEIEFSENNVIYLTTRSGFNYEISESKVDTLDELIFSGGIDRFSQGHYYLLAIDKLFEIKNDNPKQVYDLALKGYENLTDILVDKEKNIWISTWEGLVKLRRNIFVTFFPSENENLNDIFSITQAPDGKMVLGGNRGNVITYDGSGFKKYLPGDLKPWNFSEIFGMYINNDGSIWFGSGYEGISIYKNNRITNFDENKLGDTHGQDFYYDNNGKFYCLTEGKLTQILNENTPENISFKDFSWPVYYGGQYIKLFDQAVLPNNDTYFASNFGLIYFNGDTLVKANSNDLDLNGAIITSLEIDNNKNLWLSTGNFGVFHVRVNGDSVFIIEKFNKENGLLADAVLDLLRDTKGNIWAAHYNGLSLLQKNGDSWKVIKRVDESEGFLSVDFTYIKLAEDKVNNLMWLATTGGVQFFDPAELQFNKYDANPVIGNVLLFNGAFRMQEYSSGIKNFNGLFLEPKLPHNKNSITFKFQSVSLTIPAKNKCRYRLLGYSSTWNMAAGLDEITFAALAPGKYEFELQAANNDGIWSSKTDRYVFIINKPFWATWWFIISAVLLTALLSFAIYRYRLNQLLQITSIRNKIAGDLHDDIGSTLSSIRMYSDIVSEQVQNKNPESIPLLQKMGDNSKEMIENMSDIVWAIKPANDAFKNIESRMFNFAVELCNVKNIQLIMQKNVTLESIKIPMEQRRDLYLIFKEAVNNVIKYSNSTKLNIEFSKSGHFLIMIIEDNGKGFDPNQHKKGNGLENMKKRANDHHGILEINSSIGSGTKIILKMPLN